jgi:pimeloyl-ACP methyl ester carboxylesterase
MALPHPVIVVPGITAVYLHDEYPLPPEDIWKVIKQDYERIVLHPNDLRYEAEEPARVQPGQVFEIAYEELIKELRYNLASREDQPVPVFPFGYDWRMPLEITEMQLAGFVAEVIERTKLLKHYNKENYQDNPKVNLVGHSMGGLVIAGYLEREGGKAPVHKVVTLATPFQGSFEAVIKVATGTANLGTTPPSSREREAARLTPALYHLIPSFTNGIEVAAPTLPHTLFDSGLWQPSVIASLAEFIRTKGLPSPKTKLQEARDLFAFLLNQAKTHRDRIDGFKLSKANLTDKDWLAVVGVGTETRVRLRIVKRGSQPDFDLRGEDRANEWDDDDPQKKRQTGDGTVPYEGAVPKFLQEKNLVLVTPDDYGYWEVQDRTLTLAAGFHGILPNMNMLHRLIVRFFADRPDKRNNTWGRPAPGVDKKKWDPPLQLLPKG